MKKPNTRQQLKSVIQKFTMFRMVKLFAFFAAVAFVPGAVGYLALHAIMPEGRVFGALPRMFPYHESHSLQYIAVVALTYALIATLSTAKWRQLVGWRRPPVISGIIAATILIASIPGGVLWKIHDMQAGYFPPGARFWNDLLGGAADGLQLGWLIIALSFPYNILGLIIGYAVTHYGFRIGARMTCASSPVPNSA